MDEDNHQIKSVTVLADGTTVGDAVAIAGDQQAGSANGLGSVARFRSPSDIDISPDGRALYVADTSNHLVSFNTSPYQILR